MLCIGHNCAIVPLHHAYLAILSKRMLIRVDLGQCMVCMEAWNREHVEQGACSDCNMPRLHWHSTTIMLLCTGKCGCEEQGECTTLNLGNTRKTPQKVPSCKWTDTMLACGMHKHSNTVAARQKCMRVNPHRKCTWKPRTGSV